jgi:dimethylhistidine N-methyltransferase
MNFQLHNYQPDTEDLKTVVIKGLQHSPKQLHPKFFYDEIGSKLFDQICQQPEYYIPTVEQQIFSQYADEMIECIGSNCVIIEPGAGSTKKIRFLLERMQKNLPTMYVPMDISAEHLQRSAQQLANDYPELSVHAVCVDHTKPFQLPNEIPAHRRVLFYPGSSLGNFKPHEAIDFLQELRNQGGDDSALLIGIDTKKDSDILNHAYNDAAGVTAAFNLNLLTRINSELGTKIAVDRFAHHAFYNEAKSRIEMHLVSKQEQTLHILQHKFHFDAGETIHTENSYKYSVNEFQTLVTKAGWVCDQVWLDDKHYFGVYFLRAAK